MAYVYAYSCVTPDSLTELEHIIDHEEDVSHEEFVSVIDEGVFERLCEGLGYSDRFPIEKDWHVSYHTSETEDGERVYFLRHSAIEYVFKHSSF